LRVPDLSVFELTGKKALVTGGGSGIGKAGAIGFAKAGADVADADVNFEAAKKVAKQIKDSTGQNSFPIKVDVTKVNQVRKMVDEVVSKFGRLDIALTIVNNLSFPIAAYCTAKAGVKHLTKALAVELIRYNVYVNSISPGMLKHL